ncbi:MAG: hypothetical protein HZB51_08350 [Chloroflexi bacterium]|nr:hypothetical protein [Chloroflexota bacterium]
MNFPTRTSYITNTAQTVCGRDAANGVSVDGAGNVYVSGLYQNTVDFGDGNPIASNAWNSCPMPGNNVFVSKFTSDGTFQWVRTWGGTTGGESYNVAVDTVNGYVYVQGDWSTAHISVPVDFNPTGNGSGHDPHTNHGFYDAFLSKWDLQGNFQWAKTWGGEAYDDGTTVTVDNAGNVYVAGMYASININFDPDGTNPLGLGHPANVTPSIPVYGRNVDVFLVKFDNSNHGNFQWVRTWGGLDIDDAAGAVLVDHVNDVYVGGRFGCPSCDFNAGPTGTSDPHQTHNPAPPSATFQQKNDALDAFLAKYDPNGNYFWARTWGGDGWDTTIGLAVDRLNNVYTTGFFTSTANFDEIGAGDNHVSNGNRDVFLNKFDSTGTFRWAQTWGASGEDDGFGIVSDGADHLYVVGTFAGMVDFNPGSAVDNHTARGIGDVFLTKFQWLPHNLFLPLIVK